jgi:peptidoglycan-N-acetylglucosamine deacetylase
MSQSFVCLTFDYDNASSFIARGMTTPTMVSRGDYGILGAQRILDLLSKHAIRSTWFVPGHTIESYPKSVHSVFKAGHEIAHHGWTHRGPAALGRDGEKHELMRGNEAIKKLTGRYARGYRSPAWDLSPYSVELLLDHGFVYDSSLMGHDFLPYQARCGDIVTLEEPMVAGADTALIECPVSWCLDDFPHFEYVRFDTGILPGLMNANLVFEDWINEFRYMRQHYVWGIATYTFHPHVIGRAHRMMALDAMIATMQSEGAVFLTLEEAVAAYRQQYPDGRSNRDR